MAAPSGDANYRTEGDASPNSQRGDGGPNLSHAPSIDSASDLSDHNYGSASLVKMSTAVGDANYPFDFTESDAAADGQCKKTNDDLSAGSNISEDNYLDNEDSASLIGLSTASENASHQVDPRRAKQRPANSKTTM